MQWCFAMAAKVTRIVIGRHRRQT